MGMFELKFFFLLCVRQRQEEHDSEGLGRGISFAGMI
jgi:hypothetical protein